MGVEINRLASGEPIANGGATNIMFPSGGGRNGYAAIRPSLEADVTDDFEMEEARQHRRVLSDGVLRLTHEDDDDPDHHKWLDVKKNAPNAIAICLFIGACCSVVAAEATRRLKRLD
jgi:hypothetical protein